jgi:hypothetical protein
MWEQRVKRSIRVPMQPLKSVLPDKMECQFLQQLLFGRHTQHPFQIGKLIDVPIAILFPKCFLRTSLRSIMLEAEREMSQNTADSPIHSTFKKSTGSSRSNAKEISGCPLLGDHGREAGLVELPTTKIANNIKLPNESISKNLHTAFPMAIGTPTPPNRPGRSAGCVRKDYLLFEFC